MVWADERADVQQGIFGDAELNDFRLGLDLGLAEGAALRLGNVLGLGLAGAELNGGIAVAAGFTAADHLQRVIPTFFAITPVRMTKLLAQRHPTNSGACSPKIHACPAWASAPLRERRGRSPELVSGGITLSSRAFRPKLAG